MERGEEIGVDEVEWIEIFDRRIAAKLKKKKVFKDSSESCYDVWFRSVFPKIYFWGTVF